MALLEVKNLGISFGGLRAVDGFHINIKNGQLYGLIGPNGAGKTTVFNMLTGVYTPDDGSIVLDGTDITGRKTIDINKAGIARTFQNIRLFKGQSVLDNVKIGLHNEMQYSTLTGILRLPKYYKVEKEMNEKAMELLKVFGLENEAHYLCAVINSPIVAKIIEAYTIDTQRGVDILNNIAIPKFDESNEEHIRLAELSMQAHNNKIENVDNLEIEKEINSLTEKIFDKSK